MSSSSSFCTVLSYNLPVMEYAAVHFQRFCDLKLLLAPALYLKNVCYLCMVMHNIHQQRQNNVIQFYIQQLWYVQILLLNILSTHYDRLLLIKIPKTQVFGDATLCHWVRVTHPVFPCLDYLNQMTKALWTIGELGNTHETTSITSKKAWIFSNNSDNLKSWIKFLCSL